MPSGRTRTLPSSLTSGDCAPPGPQRKVASHTIMDSDEDDRTVIRPRSARTAAVSTPPTQGAPASFAATMAPTAVMPPHATTGSPATASTAAVGSGGGNTQHALTLPAGTRLAEFEVTQTIGEGGFGIVYLAWDHSLQRKVALKEYMPSSIASRVGPTEIRPRSDRHQETFEAGLRSFINEARLLAQFDHASLLKVYRFWEANGTAYMVMPFLEGGTLRDTVRALAEPPGEAWIIALLAPLFDALSMLHAAQCFHRDIAPDNILLLADTGRPLLLDFGAARRVIGESTQALTAILKPGYAPVEQYAEIPGLKQGAWTDIYALAAVVHWMVTGKTPTPSVGRLFDDAHVPLATRVAGRYSPGFLAAVDRALAVMPDKRTQTVEAFRDELMGDGVPGSLAMPAARPSAGASEPASTVARTQRQTAFPATREAATQPPARTLTQAQERSQMRTRVEAGEVAQPSAPTSRRRGIPWLWIGLGAVVIAAGAAFALWPRHSTSVEGAAPITAASPTTATSSPAPASLQPPAVEAPPPVVVPATNPTPTSVATPTAAMPASPSTNGGSTAAPSGAAMAAPHVAEPVAVPAREPAAKPSESRERPADKPAKKTRAEGRDDTTAATPTVKPANDNQAECARLFQRLSLGDTDPELAERVRALRCR